MANLRNLDESLHFRDGQQQTSFESDRNLAEVCAISGDESPMPDDSIATQPDWRELAQRVAVESDPNKMVELVQQLIAKIDEGRLQKPFASRRKLNSAGLRDERLRHVRADYSGNRG
jgi:hypothetical protein